MFPIRATFPTTAETRALLAAYRRGTGVDAEAIAAELDDEPDSTLLDLVADPFSSVEDVSDRLTRTEAYLRERDDRRAVFLTVYSRMTEAVGDAIEADFFADPEWVESYLVAFAERYRRALVAFERREFDPLPRAWLLGFAAAVRGENLVLQDALSGVNAHITYDLTYTLRDVGIDPDRGRKRADHDRINDVLARLVAAVQEALVAVYDAAGVAGADALSDPFDDRLALLGLEEVREFAWRNAVLLADLPSWAGDPYVDWRARTVSTGAAALVLAPRIDPETRRRLREAEDDVLTLTAFHDEFRRRFPSSMPSERVSE
ncbi:hypothetical protein SAMN04488066_105126 [Halorubrum aquaticum]|uniref:Uncharacterized protein n=1 Tax=Halorubrum aquaticum TaxID=387340 RepID=A0A1I3AF62_9EURY|nr:DUF5995 family protein [Halorubrum aquaticum]SFH48349.1 hypothetical protein SAMN04488066_105126 [Halorubrum aquaticum]